MTIPFQFFGGQPVSRSKSEFARALLAWYDDYKRDLPWRRTRDPYAILVSEVMLQQTQVQTVIPYYQRFLEAFPSAAALAKAEEQHLLRMWQGLGYYRRARLLQGAAKAIVAQHGGEFPRDKSAVDALPGIGPYTSAAVRSIALQQVAACVDGNVIRVLSRLGGFDGDVTSSAAKKTLQQAADQLIDHQRPGDFNQAVMELGACVCTPKKPACGVCPVSQFCKTLRQGVDPHTRPYKAKKIVASKVEYESLFLFCSQKILLAKRLPKGLMASMWELPTQISDSFQPWPQLFGEPIEQVARCSKPHVHKFTHLHATYRWLAYRVSKPMDFVTRPNSYATTAWFGQEELDGLPKTKVLQRLLPELLKLQGSNNKEKS